MDCAVVIWKGNRPSIVKVTNQLRNEFGRSHNVKQDSKFMLLCRPNSGSVTITECDEIEIIKLRLRTFALQLMALHFVGHRSERLPSAYAGVVALKWVDLLGREPINLSASRNVGQLDGFLQRGTVVPVHTHDIAQIGRNPSSFSFFIETSKLGFDLSCVHQGRRALGFQKF